MVVPVLVLLFVALWFILWGDLLYVFPCVILFLCFSVLLVLQLPCLEKRELILVLFVCLFDLCLFGFVSFLFLLGSGESYGLWLWHSLDFSLTFFLLMILGMSVVNFFSFDRALHSTKPLLNMLPWSQYGLNKVENDICFFFCLFVFCFVAIQKGVCLDCREELFSLWKNLLHNHCSA